MRRILNSFKVVALLITFLSTISLFADKATESEGTTFWFGLPFCDRSSDETLRGSETNSPYELFITSKVNTTVRLYIGKTELYKTVNVLANIPLVVALPDGFENQTSEKVEKKGFYVESDDPIGIVVYVSWKWTGEAFRVVPMDWLGTDYYTLNLYEDYNKDHAGNFRYHPAQILVVASENETDISYTPTYETQKGVKKGQTKVVRLNEGECFNIMGKLDPAWNQSWQSDLTGTYIHSNKPVAVYSGHTKGSFPRHSATMLGLKSDFMRNMYMDAMWPTTLLGLEYIQAPIMYTGRTAGYGTVPEDRGDIIRFVATQDGTTIMQMKSDGSGFTRIAGPLAKGEDFRIMESLIPAYYKSNKPVLVGQYGKSWWQSAVSSKTNDDDSKTDEELQNPPKCGQGMMFALTPNEHWCNYAGFNSPKGGMYNYVNIIFKTIHADSIFFDNRPLDDEFGSAVKKLPGTAFSYVTAAVNAGGHVVQGLNNGITFAVYAYGNLDGYKDGFAYGYPTTVNYLTPCSDDITIESTQQCETVNATLSFIDLQDDAVCAGILRLEYDKSSTKYAKFIKEPYKVGDKTAKFKIVFKNNKVDTIVVRVMSKSGLQKSYTFTYAPEIVESSTANLNYNATGLLEVGVKKCMEFDITNTGIKPAKMKRIYFNPGIPEFTIESPANLNDITLNPGEKITVRACALTNDPEAGTLKAEIWTELECYSERLVTLMASPGEPKLEFNDLTWDNVPVGTNGAEQIVTCKNSGNADGIITNYTVTGADAAHFIEIEYADGVTPPITIPADNKSYPVLKLKYTPLNEEGVTHTVTTLFETNARPDQIKLNSVWTGDGITAGPTIKGFNIGYNRVIDDWQTSHGVFSYDSIVVVENIGNVNLPVTKIEVQNNQDNAFVLDQDVVNQIIQNGLEPYTPVNIPCKFIPQKQGSYRALVKIYTAFNNEEKTAEDLLEGSGIQPHVTVPDADFGTINLNKTVKTFTQDVLVSFLDKVPGYGMDLSVFKFRIEGTDKAKFIINNEPAGTTIIAPKGTFPINITFDPKVSGDYTAYLVVDTDAPEGDDTVGTLTGKSFAYSVETTPYTFASTYITTTRTGGTCSIKNTGDVSVFIKKPLNIENDTKLGDAVAFQVIDSYLKSNPGFTYPGNTAANIEIPVGDELICNLTFSPLEVRLYNMQLRYYFNIANSEDPDEYVESAINGPGMNYLLVAKVPKEYKANPGELFGREQPAIDFILYKDEKEAKELESANITEFKAYVVFKNSNPDRTLEDGLNIYPIVKTAEDIITDGTMTQGWTVRNPQILDNSVLYISMSAPTDQYLKASSSNVLFKFKVQAYLSTEDKWNLIPSFEPTDASSGYVVKDTVPGDIIVNEVCIDTARLIKFSGYNYNVSLINPNPVQTVGTIDYTVPINCTVTLDVYNVQGEKVAVLVNQRMTPGNYKATVDTEALGISSGIYTYRIQMGPYSEVKTMIIQK